MHEAAMFAIECIRPCELVGVDPEDARWTRLLHEYESEDEAERELGWCQLEDDGLTYRVVETQGDPQ